MAGRPPRPESDRAEKHPLPVPRRQFLQRSAMAVAGGILFSCTGGRVTPKFTPRPERVSTRWPIKRVIYIMQENRSFDYVFGRFPGVNGTRVANNFGREVPMERAYDWMPGDIPHTYRDSLEDIDVDRSMSGFGAGDYGRGNVPGDPFAFTQAYEDQVPSYWHWAREYAVSDNFYASALGPSYANHMFFVAGTSANTVDTPELIDFRVDGSYKFKSWGCDALGRDGKDPFVYAIHEDAPPTQHDLCWEEVKTVGEQLTERNIDWRYYSAAPGQQGYIWNAYSYFHNVFHTDLWNLHIRGVDNIIDDIEKNDLPSVTWVTPRFELSDHPPSSTVFAHNWLTDIVNAVMRSDMWENTAIFLTWDEWGGMYDHVLPPKVDIVGMGVRVPMITISPYTKRGVVDDVVGEFSSPLKFISDNWDLPYLTDRIRDTHNFEHTFDFKQKPRAPKFALNKPETYGSPWVFPANYPYWPAGTQVQPNPF